MAADHKRVTAFPFAGEAHENYEEWSFQMTAFFRFHELDSVVDLTDAHAPDGRANAKVFDVLSMNCKGSALSIVREVRTGDGRAAWANLRDAFASRSLMRETALQTEFYARVWRPADTVATFKADIMRLRRSLIDMGKDSAIPDRQMCNKIIACLPSDPFAGVIAAHLSLDDPKKITIENLFRSMQAAETAHQATKPSVDEPTDTSVALYAHGGASGRSSSSSTSSKGNCHFCGRAGHHEAECHKKQAASTAAKADHAKKKDQPRHRDRSSHSSAHGAKANATTSAAFPVISVASKPGTVAFVASSVLDADSFCVDSGATQHICFNKRLFTKLVPFTNDSDAVAVMVGDGRKLHAEAIGTIKFVTANDSGEECTITLRDVLFIPGFHLNLLSQKRIKKDAETGNLTGHSVVDGPDGAFIRLKSGMIIPLHERGDLNWLDPASVATHRATSGAATSATAFTSDPGCAAPAAAKSVAKL